MGSAQQTELIPPTKTKLRGMMVMTQISPVLTRCGAATSSVRAQGRGDRRETFTLERHGENELLVFRHGGGEKKGRTN